MRLLPRRLRRVCAVMLVCGGACGILCSPTIGVWFSKELRSFTLHQAREHEWGTSIVTSQLDLPFISNARGILFMQAFIAGSVAAIFAGTYWFNGLQRQSRNRAIPQTAQTISMQRVVMVGRRGRILPP